MYSGNAYKQSNFSWKLFQRLLVHLNGCQRLVQPTVHFGQVEVGIDHFICLK